MINVLEYLDKTAKDYPHKTAFVDDNTCLTFSTLQKAVKAIGSFLCDAGIYKKPVVVFMPKSPNTIAAFLGVISAGCSHVPIDEEMPAHRIKLILDKLKPDAVICDSSLKDTISTYEFSGQLFFYDEIVRTSINEDALAWVRAQALDTDPVHIVFTSGSTGVPKGVVTSHRAVIDYIEALTDVLKIDTDSVFGMQVPLYVDACLKEIYSTLKFGATTWLIPKQLFMFPVKLVEFLNTHKVNTICWVVSALTLISGLGAFKKAAPEHLRTIAFGSEVFPIKQFNLWKEHVPNARYLNLYGPTEATGMSCWYEVNRNFALDEPIPIGQPFRNTEILLLDENDQSAGKDCQGEICIRGTSLAMGYFNAPEKTGEAFVQNPLNKSYPEIIYRTGDLARYNEYGELVFISRKDNQIKHMGQRIELGEIEVAANSVDGITSTGCIYDEIRSKIVMFYIGDLDKAAVSKSLRQKLPRYMVPNKIFKLQTMPYTTNGKLDRVGLKEQYKANRKQGDK